MSHTCHMMPEKWYVLLKIVVFFFSPILIISPLQPSTPPFPTLHTHQKKGCSNPGLPFYCLSSFLSIKPKSMNLGLFGRRKLKLLVHSTHQPEKAKTGDSPKNNRNQIIL